MPSLVKNVVHWGTHLRAPTPPQTDLCEICGKKPKFVDNGFKHPYCSRSCARNVQGTSPAACLLRGCRATGKPAFANFCSEVHAKEGVKQRQVDGCEQCNIQPQSVGGLCIACDRQTRGGPRLRELNPSGAAFKNIRAQFMSEWDTGGPSPSFERVYEIVLPRDLRIRHDQYRSNHATFEEVRSFHSSQCICDLGFKDSTLCNFKSCGICCIIKSSFKSFAFGAPFNRGRFGDGIYSYRNPGFADRFATSCTSSPYRVMIACDTCIEPEQSAVNQPAEEESLFVSSVDAVLPVYVIMYTK